MSEELSEERLKICKQCGMYKETYRGPVCDSHKFISEEDKTSISEVWKPGYRRGCDCRLDVKATRPSARCIVGKW